MNILKILGLLAIFIPSVVFAQTAVRSTATNDVSAVGVGIKTTGVAGYTDSERKRVEGSTAGGDIEVKSSISESVFCTADAKICPNGSGVGRVAPDCEFAKCPGERLDDDSDGDGISNDDRRSENGDGLKDGEEDDNKVDSFFDVFVDSSDEETKSASRIFLELGDIKGDSIYADGKEDNSLDGVEEGDSAKTTTTAKSKKPNEIVVIGNKVRVQVQESKVEVRGWDPQKKEVTMGLDEVQKEEDFLDFVGATILSDENIESVSLNSEKIKMEYKQPAKLFWFIPMSLTAQVELSEKNKVKVKFPWYSFLTKNNAKEVKDEIDVLSFSWGAVVNETDTEFLRDKAQKFQAISNTLKAAYDIAVPSIRNMK